ncbi:hypothetical protein EV383_4329 [Pseudonocardia sediminis]|uniref:Uncharacterized protein n=1 Tax=Pseudonocardia sediminis TaxID=1397368 RepID=A0A4Q7UZI7_PSEST|nr:hypothetical protein EV383_4329 [Pseudonocardia sediminis]
MKAGLIAGLFVWAALAEHGVVGGIAGLLVGLAAWWLEANMWPDIEGCWNPFCRKGKLSYSPFVPKAYRRCGRCGGSGRRRRVLAGGKS